MIENESNTTKDAEVAWWGDSKEVLSNFPGKIKRNLGFALRMLQSGEEPPDYRPLPAVAPGIYELREQDERRWYRVAYLSRMNDVIHVLHAFSKKSREIPQNDVNTIRQRLKQAKAWMAEEKKNAKRKK